MLTVKFLIRIYLLFLDSDNLYVTGLRQPGNQHFCLYYHTSYSVFQAFCHNHILSIFGLHFYIFFSLFFKLPLTRGLFDLFYQILGSWGQVISQSAAYSYMLWQQNAFQDISGTKYQFKLGELCFLLNFFQIVAIFLQGTLSIRYTQFEPPSS